MIVCCTDAQISFGIFFNETLDYPLSGSPKYNTEVFNPAEAVIQSGNLRFTEFKCKRIALRRHIYLSTAPPGYGSPESYFSSFVKSLAASSIVKIPRLPSHYNLSL